MSVVHHLLPPPPPWVVILGALLIWIFGVFISNDLKNMMNNEKYLFVGTFFTALKK